MKVFILAGGFGTRLAQYTKLIPKPMIKVGGSPIIIHIMNHYCNFGFKEFYLATGYKSHIIKKYFKNFKKNGEEFVHKIKKKNCKITIVDTGINTMTGGRLKRLEKYLDGDSNFMFTYGDGISDINLKKLLNFHLSNKKLVTITAVRPPARFGEIVLKKNSVKQFKEKPQVTKGWINGGFFVAKSKFLKFIRNDKEILEKMPLEKASRHKQLNAFRHHGFWKCMDTPRDKDVLDEMLKVKKTK
jgi:glucose-1-phosphate cytidylyltransferase